MDDSNFMNFTEPAAEFNTVSHFRKQTLDPGLYIYSEEGYTAEMVDLAQEN